MTRLEWLKKEAESHGRMVIHYLSLVNGTHPFSDDSEWIDTWDAPKAMEAAMVAGHFGALYLEQAAAEAGGC